MKLEEGMIVRLKNNVGRHKKRQYFKNTVYYRFNCFL